MFAANIFRPGRRAGGALYGFAAALFALSLICSSGLAAARGNGEIVYSFPSNVGPLNPHLYSPNQMFAQEMVYEGLVTLGENGEILPALAESWEVSADGLEYRFRLRENVFFSDGEPFDAAAAVKNFRAVLDNAGRHEWLPLTGNIESVFIEREEAAEGTEGTATAEKADRANGPGVLVLRLKAPYYPALNDLALPRPFRMLSPAAFPDDGRTRFGIKKPVGTGPWKLTRSVLGEYDLFERNDNYWGTKAAEARVLVKVIPDPLSRAVALETGQIDLIHGIGQISIDSFEAYRNEPGYSTGVSRPLGGMVLALNSGRGPTAELAVRKALQHAVDKSSITRGILLGTQKRADTLFSPEVPYCDVELTPYEFDPERAGSLLERAGWLKPEQGRYRIKAGQELAVDFCFVGNDPVQKALGEVLQAQLAKAGVRLNLLGEEEDSFLRRQKDGDFGMIVNPTWGPPFEPHAVIGSMLLPSHADYMAQRGLPGKARLDAMIAEVLASTGEERRRELYAQILSMLHEEAVYLPLFYFSAFSAHREEVLENVRFAPGKTKIPFEEFVKPGAVSG